MGATFVQGCLKKIKPSGKYRHISGRLLGPNSKAGHILRDQKPLPSPQESRTVNTLIVGSGISGLSAGRWLKQQGFEHFEILELEGHVGGNSHCMSNRVSPYPLGAHYITIANNENRHLIDFLEEIGVITHFEQGLPVYNEYCLCFDPEERLLINGQWQEGIIPKFGAAAKDLQEIESFFGEIEKLRMARGRDGKYAFNIPLDHASADEDYRKLDQLSFKEYLQAKGYSSRYLYWYLEYCCKDDYGQKLERISAWAGLNYFAGHKGRAANADPGAVLTWPEGNGWLVQQLAAKLGSHIRQSSMVAGLEIMPDGLVKVKVLDLVSHTVSSIMAETVIMAAPQFVNQRILSGINRPFDVAQVTYAPWMVANITVKSFPFEGLAWDNVAFGTASVGYVYAGQQRLLLNQKDKVISFYLPLCDHDPRLSRLAAYARTYAQWLDLIMPELEFMHPGITDFVENVDVWLWGHGMVSPSVGYIWGKDRPLAKQPINNRIFFAHTDVSGVSLFEEGFEQGIRAAKERLEHWYG